MSFQPRRLTRHTGFLTGAVFGVLFILLAGGVARTQPQSGADVLRSAGDQPTVISVLALAAEMIEGAHTEESRVLEETRNEAIRLPLRSRRPIGDLVPFWRGEH